jgi:hypothetical protein
MKALLSAVALLCSAMVAASCQSAECKVVKFDDVALSPVGKGGPSLVQDERYPRPYAIKLMCKIGGTGELSCSAHDVARGDEALSQHLVEYVEKFRAKSRTGKAVADSCVRLTVRSDGNLISIRGS